MKYRSLLALLLAFIVSLVTACSDAPVDQSTLTFEQLRGSGQAAICPTVAETARGKIDLAEGETLRLAEVCFQPVKIEVAEERRDGSVEYIPTKTVLLPGATLGPMDAILTAENDTLTFRVVDGIASQPTTVQLPRRELVPLLFSAKELVATAQAKGYTINASTDFEGKFKVPGYRSSSFLDPRARGSETGYDSAVGLQAAQDEFNESTVKTDRITEGELSLRISRLDASTGEFAGNFVSYQLSSDEQGTLEPEEVRIQGLFFARIAG